MKKESSEYSMPSSIGKEAKKLLLKKRVKKLMVKKDDDYRGMSAPSVGKAKLSKGMDSESPKIEKREVWEKENPMAGKKGAVKSLKYFRDAYKKNPNETRKEHLKESLDFYKKKFGKKKAK